MYFDLWLLLSFLYMKIRYLTSWKKILKLKININIKILSSTNDTQLSVIFYLEL